MVYFSKKRLMVGKFGEQNEINTSLVSATFILNIFNVANTERNIIVTVFRV
jgi:hypothetical protein